MTSTDTQQELQRELEELRLDHNFMEKYLAQEGISAPLGYGRKVGEQWVQRKGILKNKKYRWELKYRSREEVFSNVDMEEMLAVIFWRMLGRYPRRKKLKEEAASSDFCLAFLRHARAAQWRGLGTLLSLLQSPSAAIPSHIRLAAYIYLMTRSPKTLLQAGLPLNGFELDKVVFSSERKKRWHELTVMGVEAMFKERRYQAQLAADLSTAKVADWFSFALSKHCLAIVCSWLDSYSEADLGMSYRQILIYAVGNYRGDDAVSLVKKLESIQPGICAGFQDARGQNLLWYSSTRWHPRPRRNRRAQQEEVEPQTPQSQRPAAWQDLACEYEHLAKKRAGLRKLLTLLFSLGVSPQAANALGFTFQDLDDYGRMIGARWRFTRINADVADFSCAKTWKLRRRAAL